jgi:hypothetical protein
MALGGTRLDFPGNSIRSMWRSRRPANLRCHNKTRLVRWAWRGNDGFSTRFRASLYLRCLWFWLDPEQDSKVATKCKRMPRLHPALNSRTHPNERAPAKWTCSRVAGNRHYENSCKPLTARRWFVTMSRVRAKRETVAFLGELQL